MPPLDTDTVLRKEAEAIHGKDLGAKSGGELNRSLSGLSSAALCLSGGGIRSASFALGVIQALAAHPRTDKGANVQTADTSLLAKFHYLSTVSGGGYIGSWLSAWVTRAGFAEVWSSLVGRPKGVDIEPPAIGWLRSYSNYLTPKLGLVSADFWAALAIILRNLILNWLVIVPVLCLALLGLKGFAIAVAWFSQFDPRGCEPWFFAAVAAGCISLLLALFFTTRNRPTRGSSNARQAAFLAGDLAPAVLSGIFFTLALASPCAFNFIYSKPMPAFALREVSIFGLGLVGGPHHLLGWALAFPEVPWLEGLHRRHRGVARRRRRIRRADGAWCPPYVGVYDSVIGLFSSGEVLLIVFGVPWALTCSFWPDDLCGAQQL